MDTSFVYYRRQDYAGLARRLAAGTLDLVVLGACAIGLVIAGGVVGLPSSILGLWVVFAYLYLTLMKRWVGTVGYLATGIRIVDLRGGRPGMALLSLRLLWWGLAPFALFNVFVDFVFLAGDEDRQTIHDKMMRTYVIRKSAQPAGHGALTTVNLCIMGLSVIGFEVTRQPAR